ncbi:hypothetical protein MHLP_01325 [Candidatus Mycoplasma haematolamae str. Purdue]|uniref:Uncharacterized protein n=1 Tax=Mycoplasma haematolamae (strain Purdue) TaxID=1212765 RepID=I7B989_MYCHA|nr:hypothetical protein [Candidatus Mycoplasma haematolamae]AFO51845.1 hypothetical protein MHLP_01325 [Candidatus Mycoplasma haematolamae str. Purdue]
MLKEVALGFGGLGAVGGVGILSGYFGRPVLEIVGLVSLKGRDVAYTIKAGGDSKRLVCKGQAGKFASLKLEKEAVDYSLKAKLICADKDEDPDLGKNPLTHAFSSESVTVTCKLDSFMGTAQTVGCSSTGKKLSLTEGKQSPNASIIVTLS